MHAVKLRSSASVFGSDWRVFGRRVFFSPTKILVFMCKLVPGEYMPQLAGLLRQPTVISNRDVEPRRTLLATPVVLYRASYIPGTIYGSRF